MPEYVVFIVFVLWMVFCVFIWLRQGSSKQRRVNESWLPLAQRTGLTFFAGGRPSLMGAWDQSGAPRVTGEYRGHPVEMRLDSRTIDLYEGSANVSYTVLSMQVSNRSECMLSAGEKGILAKILGKRREAAETVGLDSRFRFEGHPPEFLRNASHLIGPLLQQRETEGTNDSPFFWSSDSKSPFLVLNGSDLTWQQYDVVLDPEVLQTLLDELSDLAELIERQ